MNRCNISFAKSRVEDCLELNFKYVDYQTLAHLSYTSCVCWSSVHATRVQCFLSVQVLISASSFVSTLIVKWPGMFKFQKGYHSGRLRQAPDVLYVIRKYAKILQ